MAEVVNHDFKLPIIEVGLALILSAYSGPRGTPKPRDYSLKVTAASGDGVFMSLHPERADLT